MYNPTKPYKEQVVKLVKRTWDTNYVNVANWRVTKYFNPNTEYHHTDGIGTKGIYHLQKRSFKNAVIDALAMNLNDLAIEGAVPYGLVDHLLMTEEDVKAIYEIMENLSKECKKRNIAITGGETAIHNNMEGLEISITMLGYLNNPPKINKFRAGDMLVGLESSGLHSNGFTRIRELYGNGFCPEFIVPTYIYLDLILDICSEFKIYGMAHITGGAFTKIKGFLSRNANAKIFRNHKLNPQNIFSDIYSKILFEKDPHKASEEMYKTFNCGIGFIFGIREKDVEKCLNYIKEKSNFKADVVGEVVSGLGNVIIESNFSNNTIIY